MLSKTVQPTELEKKRLPAYFAVASWTSYFIFHFYNALNVSSLKMELICGGKYFL